MKEYCAGLKPLSRGLDIKFLQGEDNCFFGTVMPTLETIIKKVVALRPDLSSMTIGLVGAVEDAIRHRFQRVFQNNNAIIAAVSVPKFKLKWVESSSKKDLYKQMLIQEMQSHAADEVVVVQESQDHPIKKKDDFYDFQSDDESESQSNVEIETINI